MITLLYLCKRPVGRTHTLLHSSTHTANKQKAYKPACRSFSAGRLPLILSLITCAILHTEISYSQAGLWSASGPTGVTTNRYVSINNGITAEGDAYFHRKSYFDSLLTANRIRAQLISAGHIIADSAELDSLISYIIIVTRINSAEISTNKIDALRVNADTMVTGILGCGSAKFTGTILANNISAAGTTTLNNVVLNDGVTVPAFAGSTGGLLQYNSSGQLARIDFTSDSNDILTGRGTFRNITSLIPPDTKWQWIGPDLTTTANDIYIPNSLYVGKTINIGPFKISNGGSRDTIRTAAGLAIVSDAQSINIAADTVRMPKYVEAPNIKSSQLQVAGDAIITNNLTVGGYMNIGTGTKMISNGSYRDTLRTAKELSVISDANLINLEADTVRMTQLFAEGRVNTPIGIIDSLTSDRIRVARLTVSGDVDALNGTVTSNEVRTNTLATGSINVTGQTNIKELHILDSIKIGNSMILGSTYNGYESRIYTSDGNLFIQSKAPTGYHTIINAIPDDGGGNLGVGTITPGKKLHIKTTHLPPPDVSEPTEFSHQGIRLENWVGSNSSIWDVEPIIDTGSKFTIGTPHRPRFTLQENGRTGFNTIDPKNDLHLHSDSMVNYSSYVSPFNGVDPPPPGLPVQVGLDIMQITNASTGKTASDGLILGTFHKETFFVNQEYGHMKFATNDSTRMTITAAGHIGIGTKTPQATLDVHGTFRLNNGTQQQGYVLTSNGDGNGSWQPLGTEWTQSGNDIYNNTTGNVGIGTQSPEVLLHVRRQGYPASSFPYSQGALLKVQQSSNDDWAAEFYNNGGSGKGLRVIADGGSSVPVLQVDDNYYTRFTVLANGKVYIGTPGNSGTHSDALLQVGGKILARHYHATIDSWNDHIFNRLRTQRSSAEIDAYYKRLEEYYFTSRHLEGVAPEPEILVNGLDIPGTLTGLTMNTEEIRLDMIEFYKILKAQAEEIKILRETNAEMKKEIEFLRSNYTR